MSAAVAPTNPPEPIDANARQPPARITSLDQFRGYTVFGMLLVNFLGNWNCCPSLWRHHHDHCSYADTIMPQFLFAVGFALRLTLRRGDSTTSPWKRVARRALALALISVVVYSPGVAAADWAGWSEKGFAVLLRPLKREWFQTLMHIAVTSVWIVPAVRASLRTRALFAAASGLAHVVLSYWFNFAWVNSEPWGIDGGPLGFLTWTIPAIVGTVACDGVTGPDSPKVGRLSCLAVALMVAGWGFSCGTRLYDVPAEQRGANAQEKFASSPVWPDWNQAKGRAVTTLLAEPPFVRPPPASERQWNYWMMSQRAGTLSYLTFSGGFSLLVFVGFWWCCDRWGWRLGLFQSLGTNALAAYVIHGLVDSAISPFVPRDAPVWYVTAAFACYFALTWGAVKGLERQWVFLRV